jgi:hypothetical protein
MTQGTHTEQQISRLVDAVRRACRAIELVDLYNTRPLTSALIDLLQQADSLANTKIEVGDEDLVLTKALPTAVKKIPDDVLFYVVFDPLDPGSVCSMTLKDALGDIYEPLASGLELLDDRPEKKYDVAWEWRNGYAFHWGRHLLDVIRALTLSGDIMAAKATTDAKGRRSPPSAADHEPVS